MLFSMVNHWCHVLQSALNNFHPLPRIKYGAGSSPLPSREKAAINFSAPCGRGLRGGLIRLLTIYFLFILYLLYGAFSSYVHAGTWYKGDLHAHSTYSDGDSPVSEVIASAESKGLDFFVITDHDTSMHGNPVHWSDPAYHSDVMVLLYGVEWTTPLGHANVWAAAPFSYAELWQANRARDAGAAAGAAHQQNALFSINHPETFFTSSWEYPVDDTTDSIEVWNCMYRLPSTNRWAEHHFWDTFLKSGKRIPGVGGSDTHQIYKWESLLFGHGNPTTWVYAGELTEDAILAAIKAGHVSISYAPDAPRLDFFADVNGDGVYEAMAGDNTQSIGEEVSFKAEIVVAEDTSQGTQEEIFELNQAQINALQKGVLKIEDLLDYAAAAKADTRRDMYAAGVFKNGTLYKVFILTGNARSFTFKDTPESATYYRVELVGSPDVTPVQQLLYGRVIALTNPIYFGYPK